REYTDDSLRHVDEQPALCQFVRRVVGKKTAASLERRARVLANDCEQVLVEIAGLDQLHGRNLQAFLVDRSSVRSLPQAADIDLVATAAGKRDGASVAKHRRENCEIVQVTRCEPRIVGDELIARP